MSGTQDSTELQHPSAPSAYRKPEIWTLGGVNLLAAVLCYLGTVAPLTAHHFVATGIATGSCFAVLGALMFTVVWRRPLAGRFAVTLADVGLVAGMATQAHTAEGAALVAFAWIWTTIYAASFFPQLQTRILVAATAVASACGLGIDGARHWGAIWVFANATTLTIAIVVGRSAGLLRHDAETDELTGALNRRGFQKAAELTLSVARRAGLALTLVILDLDDFKAVNDTSGHAAGDRVLAEATAAWKTTLREGDLFCRFGGDEFLFLFPAVGTRQLDAVIERLRLAHPIEWTAGLATWREDESFESCLERADRELYLRKDERRARIEQGRLGA